MRREIGLTFLLAACTACGPTQHAAPHRVPTPTEVRADVRRLLASLLEGGPPRSFTAWDTVRVRGRVAVAPLGPLAFPALLATAEDSKATPPEKFLALTVLTELDAQGTRARELLGLLAEGTIAIGPAWDEQYEKPIVYVQGCLARFLQEPKDLEKLSDLLARDKVQLRVFAGRTSHELPMRTQARLFPILLPRVSGDPVGWLLGHVDYYVGGEATRNLLLAMARDEARPPAIRWDAAVAWASRCTRADYNQVRALLMSLQPWSEYPPSTVLETLAMLDWGQARGEFAEAFRAFRDAAARTPEGVPRPPFPYGYYEALGTLGSEEQVREVLGALVQFLDRAGKIAPNGPEQYRLVTWGFREAAPLVLRGRFPSVHPKLNVWFNLGLDPEPMVRSALAEDPPIGALGLIASYENWWSFPRRLAREHAHEFVALAERVLEQDGRDRGQDAMAPYNAFVTLCRLAPEKAEKHIARFATLRAEGASHRLCSPRARRELARIFESQLLRHEELDKWDVYRFAESLHAVSGKDGLRFVQRLLGVVPDAEKRFFLVRALRRGAPSFASAELTRLLRAEPCEKRRLEIAESLLRTRVVLDREQRRLVTSELLAAMECSAGAPRLDLAAELAVLSNEEGASVYQAFLRGQWRPRTNFHASVRLLALFAQDHPEPYAGRARQLLSQAVQEAPDPNVRAWAVRECGRHLGASGARGKGFLLVDLLIAQLDPRKDWRARCEAGLALRRAFREVNPTWDYYHFWPPERQRQSARELAEWWERHQSRLEWEAVCPWVSSDGYFVFKR
ncbi:MAG TPA: hypothetical protein VNE39_20605 [Planctomycetota bacterium]|nr:hypothetical protein [Planctomycetota bacterium]